MKWASNNQVTNPKFNQVYIDKRSVTDEQTLINLLELYNLGICSKEQMYYIIDGDQEDLDEFHKFWSD